MKPIKIGILGCGTVGTGVAKLLIENQAMIRSRLGTALDLKYVADIDTQTDRGIQFPEGVFISDAHQVLDDPDIDIVVEMIGGKGIAKEFMLKAIENGKHVVTANKALLASFGNEIIEKANAKNVDIGFEASVGGCMPIIKTLRESLVGNKVKAMTGILNGTCNYILSKITDEKSTFANALALAQENGFAEADPTLDIEGHDTAHKLAIIVSLAYGTEINLDDIYIEGISRITPMDIEYAEQFGYRIKLLAISKNRGDAVEARVHPAMIPFENLLSNVNGSLNAITISGDAVGDMLLYGHGAGMMPTASAVVGDIVDIARNLRTQALNRIPIRSFQPDQMAKLPILPMQETRTHYYLRFAALDQPGVLANITGILGKHRISIENALQRGRKFQGAVPIVMFTHRAKEADIQSALNEISTLSVVKDKPVIIRIEDENKED